MRRARLNLVVDAVVGAAFLVTALTGVAFLLPVVWQQVVLVGLSFHAWHWLHDWSGAVAAAGVALHLALHWRWVVHTARRWLADARGEPDRRPAAGRAPAPSRVGPPSQVAQATPHEALERRPERASRPHDRSAGLLTRRRFIVGAAGFGVAAIGGVALSRVAAAIGSGQATATGGTSSGQGAASSSSSGTAGAGSAAGSSPSGTAGVSSGTSSSGSGASAGAGGTTTTAARVVVDPSSCVACGRCLEVCPKSVFDWDSAGRATAVSPDSCILCRRCVQVCPASAITLTA